MQPITLSDSAATITITITPERFFLRQVGVVVCEGSCPELLDNLGLGDELCRLFDMEVLAEARGAARLFAAGVQPGAPAALPERARLTYMSGFGRGVHDGFWLFGRTLRISTKTGAVDFDIDRVAQQGLDDDLAWPSELRALAIDSATQRASYPCACGTGAPSPAHHGSTREIAYAQDRSATVEVHASLATCTVCAARLLFTYEGDPYYDVRETCRVSRV